MNGKGSKPRPINKTKFDRNFDDIVWQNEKTKAVEIIKSKIGKAKRYIYR